MIHGPIKTPFENPQTTWPRIAKAEPAAIFGTQMERHVGKRLVPGLAAGGSVLYAYSFLAHFFGTFVVFD